MKFHCPEKMIRYVTEYRFKTMWILCLFLISTIATTFLTSTSRLNPETQAQEVQCAPKPADIMIVLDASSSMNYVFEETSERRINVIRRVTPKFLDAIDYTRDQVGLTLFNYKADLMAPIGAKKDELLSLINNYSLDGGTNIPEGLKVGGENIPIVRPRNFIVLITDGQNFDKRGQYTKDEMNAFTIDRANELKKKGYFIAALGLATAEQSIIENVASSMPNDPSKKFAYMARSEGDLERFYKLLVETINSCTGTEEAGSYPVSMQTSCADPNRNPYKIKFDMKIGIKRPELLEEAYAVLTPSSGTVYAITYANGSISGQFGTSVQASSKSFIANQNFFAEKGFVNISSDPQAMTTNIDFLRNSGFYQQFQHRFDLYLYVKEKSGKTNLKEGKLPKVVSNHLFNSIDNCARVYFSTAGGDFRSYEPGAYQGQIDEKISYGPSGNKFWQSQNTDGGRYQAFDNDATAVGFPPSASFMFEAPAAVGGRSSINKLNGFDVNIPVTGEKVSRDTDVLGAMVDTMNHSVRMGALFKYEFSSDTSKTTLGVDKFLSVNEAEKTITVRLKDLGISNALVVLDNNEYSKVIIEDSETTSPDAVIVWCKTRSCDLHIKSIKYAESVNFQNGSQISFNEASVREASKKKARIYLNYLDGETPTTPLEQAGSAIPPTRSIHLLGGDDTNRNNFFIGGLLTNGFVFTSKSSKTDLLKGFVVARGVVASAQDAGVSKLYFKDYGLPLLHILYDPKYYFSFSRILITPNKINQRSYIGL